MKSTIENSSEPSLAISGRSLVTLDLAPGDHLQRTTAIPEASDIHLTMVLQGTLVVEDRALDQGSWLLGSSLIGRAAESDCKIAVLSWNHGATVETEFSEPANGVWYADYEAFLRPLKFANDVLAPWTGYWIKIPAANETIAVHVHHALTNIVAIAGDGAETAGYLVAQSAGFEASPLVAGDLVVVDPKTIHNLVAAPHSKPLKFFVFNNNISNYHEPNAADYHNMTRVGFSELTILRRKGKKSGFLRVKSQD
jgi:hypothetical protein